MNCFGSRKKKSKKATPPKQSLSSYKAETSRRESSEQPVEPPHQNLLKTISIHSGDDRPPPEFSDEQLAEHMAAYRKARYYHATRPKHVKAILNEGLDPTKRGSAEGAEVTSNPEGVENAKKDPAVFLGGDMTTTRYYNRQLGQPRDTPHLRAFLTPDEVETTPEDMGDSDNLAFRTRSPVGPRSIIHGRHADQSPEALKSIFGIVRAHYPKGGEGLDVHEVMQRHAVAIEKGETVHKRDERGGMQVAKELYRGKRRYQGGDDGYLSD